MAGDPDVSMKSAHTADLNKAVQALGKVLDTNEKSRENVGVAVDALTALSIRMDSSASNLTSAAKKYEALATGIEESGVTVEGLEHDIIDSKMRVVGALEERDSLARDLSRARKELAALPAPEVAEGATKSAERGSGTSDSNGSANAATQPSPNGDPGSTDADETRSLTQSTEAEQARARAAEEKTRQEIARLKELDSKIVAVTDEMDTTRKRRQALAQRLSSAYNEL